MLSVPSLCPHHIWQAQHHTEQQADGGGGGRCSVAELGQRHRGALCVGADSECGPMQSVSMHQRVEFFFRCSGASPTCNPFANSIHLPELAGLKKAGVYIRVLSEVADSFYPCRVGTVASSRNLCRGGLGVPDSECTVSPCFFRCLGWLTQRIECRWLS